MKRPRSTYFRSPSLFGLGLIVAVTLGAPDHRPRAEGNQDDRTAPVLLNENEVSRRLNDALRDQLRGLQIEADGELRVVVDAEGRPIRHWMTVATGYEALDRAVTEVVSIMRFKPASEAGKPVPCIATIPVAFRTDGADLLPKTGR